MRLFFLSSGYRIVRRIVIVLLHVAQRLAGRARDLEPAVVAGDAALRFMDRAGRRFLFRFSVPDGIGVSLYDLYFPSPVTAAAFKDDPYIMSIWYELGLGGGILKTVLAAPRQGNARPRLQETHMNGKRGLLNAMGLPGKGIDAFLEELGRTPLARFGRPIGVSVGGHSLDEYKENAEKVCRFREAHPELALYMEINISCPNTPEGQQMSKHPELLKALLAYIRAQGDIVTGVKLSPDQTEADLRHFAMVIGDFSRMYINVGNTQYKKPQEVGLGAQDISIGGGGYSGPALFPRTLEMVRILAPLGVPLIATGGVSCEDDALAVLKSGATLVGMATTLVQDPYTIVRINRALAREKSR